MFCGGSVSSAPHFIPNCVAISADGRADHKFTEHNGKKLDLQPTRGVRAHTKQKCKIEFYYWNRSPRVLLLDCITFDGLNS